MKGKISFHPVYPNHVALMCIRYSLFIESLQLSALSRLLLLVLLSAEATVEAALQGRVGPDGGSPGPTGGQVLRQVPALLPRLQPAARAGPGARHG